MANYALSELYIALIEAFGAPKPPSNGPGELLEALIVAVQNFTGGGGSVVFSVSAGDASVVVTPTIGNVVVVSGTLDQIANLHHAVADWTNNSHKITNLANGTASSDAAAFGQIPTSLPPNGSAGGDLTGTYPNPTIKASVGLTGAPTAPTAAIATNTTQLATTAFVQAGAPVNVLTTVFTANAYTLALSDYNSAQQANAAGASCQITVPTNASVAFPVGTVVTVTQTGSSGKVHITAAGGVTIISSVSGGFSSGVTGCRIPNSTIGLLKTGTDSWVMSGDVG